MTPTATPTFTVTPTATPTLVGQGPIVTYLGVFTGSDGCCVTTPTPTPDALGRHIYDLKGGLVLIVVEGGPAPSRATPGTSTLPGPPDNRPDIQIETTQALGNGSTAVCDVGSTSTGGGGVPGINPPDFTLESNPGPVPGTITGALDDFACRFVYHQAQFQCTYTEHGFLGPTYAGSGSLVQFCSDLLSANSAFNPGPSTVTVRLRDANGNVGPTAQIVVRVSPPTPTPTPKP